MFCYLFLVFQPHLIALFPNDKFRFFAYNLHRMSKIRVYLDTSVISYLFHDDKKEKMEITWKLWDVFKEGKFDVCISPLVKLEISRCSSCKRNMMITELERTGYTLVFENQLSYNIAKQVMFFRILSPINANDIKHISIAMANGCAFILSWDFRHFVNKKTIEGINKLALLNSLSLTNILSPESFLILYKEDLI